jgi:4-hydroxybenzoate polyprenyltransferase
MTLKKKNKLNDWLQLIRIPNLFTVPGDILAGHAAVTAFSDFNTGRFLFLCLASALLYCSGLILNDCFDYEEDLRERPNRPLPSGAIQMQEAYAGWLMMTGMALLISWFISPTSFKVSLAIIALVILYNGPARKFPKVAFVVMGLCRGFNILLGASTAWGTEGFVLNVSPIFLTETFYILAVTYIAYNETKKLPAHLWCMMPLIVAAAGGALAVSIYGFNIIGISLFIFFLLVTTRICNSLDDSLPTKMIPPKIGQLIRNLMLLQAAFAVIAAPEYIWYALLLVGLSPIAARISQKFYSS